MGGSYIVSTFISPEHMLAPSVFALGLVVTVSRPLTVGRRD